MKDTTKFALKLFIVLSFIIFSLFAYFVSISKADDAVNSGWMILLFPIYIGDALVNYILPIIFLGISVISKTNRSRLFFVIIAIILQVILWPRLEFCRPHVSDCDDSMTFFKDYIIFTWLSALGYFIYLAKISYNNDPYIIKHHDKNNNDLD